MVLIFREKHQFRTHRHFRNDLSAECLLGSPFSLQAATISMQGCGEGKRRKYQCGGNEGSNQIAQGKVLRF